MAVKLTDAAESYFKSESIKPQLVLEIEGLETIFGGTQIQQKINYGDFDLDYGDPGIVYGGSVPVSNQKDIISMDRNTSKGIKQVLNPDKGEGSGVQNLRIALVDINQEATKLITPDGGFLDEVLGKRVKIWYGPAQGNYKDDYIIIFRGLIQGVLAESGLIVLDIAGPDKIRRQEIFSKVSTDINGAIDDVTTSITLTDASEFLTPILGPDGLQDPSIEFYVRIDDELIQYTGISGNALQGVVRGALETTASAHSENANVESFIRLKGNAIDLALKLMLSGWNGPYIENVEIDRLANVEGETIPNAMYFNNTDVVAEFGLVPGTYITVSGSAIGGNNVTAQVTQIIKAEYGEYVLLDGVTFTEELDTDAVFSARSQYDVFPDGVKMAEFEVDVDGHLEIQSFFLLDYQYDFYIKDSIDNAREFIDRQIYLPFGGFSIPRKAKSGVGIHTPPVPGELIKTLDVTNVKNPSNLIVRRDINRNFYNAVAYKFEEDPIDDRFGRGVVYVNNDSLARIDIGKRVLTIESKGLRLADQGLSLSSSASNRLLKKYKFGAESIRNLKVTLETGVNLEIGDIVVVDFASLKLSDIQSGTRAGDARLMQIDNWELDFATGQVTLALTDTLFDKDQRASLVPPASKIKSGLSSTQFIIEQTNPVSRFGPSEYRKWEEFSEKIVVVRSPDFSRYAEVRLTQIEGNKISVDDLGFTPVAGDFLEVAPYSTQDSSITIKYGFLSDGGDFPDGKPQYTLF